MQNRVVDRRTECRSVDAAMLDIKGHHSEDAEARGVPVSPILLTVRGKWDLDGR
jgi:hypothetical protein